MTTPHVAHTHYFVPAGERAIERTGERAVERARGRAGVSV
jgi:hypothetical protein